MREEIVQHFTTFLDRALAAGAVSEDFSERLSARLDEDSSVPLTAGDFYAVWAELTSVTQEVKLQSRSFKQLDEGVQGMKLELRRIGDQNSRLTKEREAEIERRTRGESIDVLLDLRDRLERGLETAQLALAQPVRFGWLQRLIFGRAAGAAEALREGYVLGMERLDAYMEKQQIARLDSLGAPFDANSMQVVAIETTDRAPEGTVVEIFRNGYEWRGAIYRTAQVKVAKRDAPKSIR
jgi:molecular chaperone GrpE (heat shock protein)